MADTKPIECFICSGKLFEIEDGHFGCDTCKRVWVEHHDQWMTIPRKVRIVKMPEEGDSIDDIIKPIPPDEDD